MVAVQTDKDASMGRSNHAAQAFFFAFMYWSSGSFLRTIWMTTSVPVSLATLEETVRWRLMSVCLVLVRMEEHVLTSLMVTAASAAVSFRWDFYEHCNVSSQCISYLWILANITHSTLDIFRVKIVRQISTVVAPIHVQTVAPVWTYQMISGAAVLQCSQDLTVQLKLKGVSFLPAYMGTALWVAVIITLSTCATIIILLSYWLSMWTVWQHWQFQSCQVTWVGDMHGRAAMPQLSFCKHNHNWPEFYLGNARGLEPPLLDSRWCCMV